MTNYVALLRAVNVGGRTVAMADLRRGLADLGMDRVQTYVQSGNVVFAAEDQDPNGLATVIESLIERDFALPAKTLVVSAEQLAVIAAANPFPASVADERSLHATFLFAPVPQDSFAALELPARDGERTALDPSRTVVYLHLPHGYGRSKLGNAYFERVLKTPATTRNWRTVRALVELSSETME
jgi:uncharacterized protein (DUF1697 family)